ncbi:MAG: hypothetical protein COB60_00480 [Flavobacteriaceae bacterium]|nr:MAG: hypothetical protein COB60_00480 [Flavobacteriaceae bacterium]
MKNQLATNNSPISVSAHLATSHHEKIKKSFFAHSILKGLKTSIAIINTQNEFVFASDLLLKNFGYDTVEELVGKKIGEALKCVYFEPKMGCGNNKICSSCKMNSVLINDENANRAVVLDTNMIVNEGDAIIEKNYEISLTPIELGTDKFGMLTINDVSAVKRIKHLETAFLKRLNDQIAKIKQFSMVDLELTESKNDLREEVKFIRHDKIIELEEHIKFQQLFSEAQNSTLTICKEKLNSRAIFESLEKDFKMRCIEKSVSITKGLEFEDFNFYSDKNILTSTFVALLKNALSASSDDSVIEMSATLLNNNIIFSIHNTAVMSSFVQLKVYRNMNGIGTYATKLFIEKYLDGQVYFTSIEGLGTTFYIKIPLVIVC